MTPRSVTNELRFLDPLKRGERWSAPAPRPVQAPLRKTTQGGERLRVSGASTGPAGAAGSGAPREWKGGWAQRAPLSTAGHGAQGSTKPQERGGWLSLCCPQAPASEGTQGRHWRHLRAGGTGETGGMYRLDTELAANDQGYTQSWGPAPGPPRSGAPHVPFSEDPPDTPQGAGRTTCSQAGPFARSFLPERRPGLLPKTAVWGGGAWAYFPSRGRPIENI